jgi:hypothetical protein
MPHDTLKLPQTLVRTLRKMGPFTLPGATPATTAAVARLLDRDRVTNHCFFGPGFHNHLSHQYVLRSD